MKLQAVNGVIILKKDDSYSLPKNDDDIRQIPEPYTGYVDSMGFETDEYHIGEHLVFCDMGGAYIQLEGDEYVVITPDMIIGKID